MTGNKLYITVSEQPVGGNGNGNEEEKDEEEKEGGILSHYAKNQLIGLAKSTVRTSIGFSISQLGNLKGEYDLQRQVQLAYDASNKVIGIGVATFAGFKVGGVAGAILGAGIGIVETGIGIAVNLHNQSIEIKKQNYQIDLLRKRAGLDDSTNGGRTGNQ